MAAYFTYSEVAHRRGISVSTLKRMIRAGEFPPPVKLSPGRVGWPTYTIQGHLSASGATMEPVSAPQVAQVLQSIAAQIDTLCWVGDSCNVLMPPMRNKLAIELQAVLAGALSLASKYSLSENVWLDLHGPVLEEGRLTSTEAIRQLCHGSRCPEAFGEALRELADEVTKGASHA